MSAGLLSFLLPPVRPTLEPVQAWARVDMVAGVRHVTITDNPAASLHWGRTPQAAQERASRASAAQHSELTMMQTRQRRLFDVRVLVSEIAVHVFGPCRLPDERSPGGQPLLSQQLSELVLLSAREVELAGWRQPCRDSVLEWSGRSEQYKLRIGALQLDNQIDDGDYDFPVVLAAEGGGPTAATAAAASRPPAAGVGGAASPACLEMDLCFAPEWISPAGLGGLLGGRGGATDSSARGVASASAASAASAHPQASGPGVVIVDGGRAQHATIERLAVRVCPVVLNVEDRFVMQVVDVVRGMVAVAHPPMEVVAMLGAAGTGGESAACRGPDGGLKDTSAFVASCPRDVAGANEATAAGCRRQSRAALVVSRQELRMLCKPPLLVEQLELSSVELIASAHAAVRVFVSVDGAKLRLDGLLLRQIFVLDAGCLLEALGARYARAAMLQAGWAVGSLDLLGNPSRLARTLGSGLRDLVALPMEGLGRQGARGFVSGLGRGVGSFLGHTTTGTLTSVAGFAASLGRNLDQLAMDPEFLRARNQIMPRSTPGGGNSGSSGGMGPSLAQGLAGLGLTLLGAVAGLADQPLRVVMGESGEPATAGALLAGLGRGVVGVFAKPMGGAMGLVAHASRGLLERTGLHSSLARRAPPQAWLPGRNSVLLVGWKVLGLPNTALHLLAATRLLAAGGATAPALVHRESCWLALTAAMLHVVDVHGRAVLQAFPLTAIADLGPHPSDPSVLVLVVGRAGGLGEGLAPAARADASAAPVGAGEYRFVVAPENLDSFVAQFRQYRTHC